MRQWRINPTGLTFRAASWKHGAALFVKGLAISYHEVITPLPRNRRKPGRYSINSRMIISIGFRKMDRFFGRFAKGEDGAVTVDWVVITAGIVLLASLVGNGIRDETISAGERIGAQVAAMEVKDW